jgi:uncharacterized protein YjbJ (UPF0337 family)
MAGRVTEMKGAVKEAAGKALGNEQWQLEGKAEKLRGKTEREMQGMKDEAVGSFKKGAGKMLGNEQMQMEGEGERIKGRAERMG